MEEEYEKRRECCQPDTLVLYVLIGTTIGFLLGSAAIGISLSVKLAPLDPSSCSPNATVSGSADTTPFEIQVTQAVGLLYLLPSNITQALTYVHDDSCSPLLIPYVDQTVNATMSLVQCLWQLNSTALEASAITPTACLLAQCGSSELCVATCTPSLAAGIGETVRLFLGYVYGTATAAPCLVLVS
jgi:hypothetical protein